MDPVNGSPSPSSTAGPPPERTGVRTRELLDVLFKRRRAAMRVFLVVLALAAVATFARRPRYEAQASILLKYGREYVTRPEVGADRPLISLTPEEVLNSEVQILTSDDLVRSVVVELGPRTLYQPSLLRGAPREDDAVKRFREGLSVEAVKRSSVLQLSFEHPDPQLAARALHVLVDRYEQKHLQVFSDATLEFQQRQLADYEAKLKESERRLEAFRQAHGVYDYDEQMGLLLRRRAELVSASRQATVELGEIQRRLGTLSGALEGPRPPDVSGELQKDSIRLQGDAVSRRSRVTGVAKLLDEVDAQIRELDGTERELAALRRDRDQNEKNFATYREKVEEVRLASSLNRQKLSNISVIDAGHVPTRPATPRRAVGLLLGVALGLLSAALWVVVAERLAQGISTPEAAERRLDLPVLANVTHFQGAGDAPARG